MEMNIGNKIRELRKKKGITQEQLASALGIIPMTGPDAWEPDSPITKIFRRRLREHFGDTRLLGVFGDGTFGIPDGTEMYEFAYRTEVDISSPRVMFRLKECLRKDIP